MTNITLDGFLRKYYSVMYAPSETTFFKEVLYGVIGESNLKYVTPQKTFVDSERKNRRIDFSIETEKNKFAIEVEGGRYHDPSRAGPEKHTDDTIRQNDLMNAGYKVFRFTWKLIQENPAKCRETLKRAFQSDKELNGGLNAPAFPLYCPSCGTGLREIRKTCYNCRTDLDLDNRNLEDVMKYDNLTFQIKSREGKFYSFVKNAVEFYYSGTTDNKYVDVSNMALSVQNDIGLIKVDSRLKEDINNLVSTLNPSRGRELMEKLTAGFASRVVSIAENLIKQLDNELGALGRTNRNYEEIQAYLRRHIVDKELFTKVNQS